MLHKELFGFSWGKQGDNSRKKESLTGWCVFGEYVSDVFLRGYLLIKKIS